MRTKLRRRHLRLREDPTRHQVPQTRRRASDPLPVHGQARCTRLPRNVADDDKERTGAIARIPPIKGRPDSRSRRHGRAVPVPEESCMVKRQRLQRSTKLDKRRRSVSKHPKALEIIQERHHKRPEDGVAPQESLWILGHGRRLKVLGPLVLRNEVNAHAADFGIPRRLILVV